VGLLCNLMVRPLAPKWFMTAEELAAERRRAHEAAARTEVAAGPGAPTSPLVLALAWAAVGIPLGWGLYRSLLSIAKFFG
jgi:hypothetical protein